MKKRCIAMDTPMWRLESWARVYWKCMDDPSQMRDTYKTLLGHERTLRDLGFEEAADAAETLADLALWIWCESEVGK